MPQGADDRTETIMGLIEAVFGAVLETLRAAGNNAEFGESASLLGDTVSVVEIARDSIRALAREPSERAAFLALTDVGTVNPRLTSIMTQMAQSAVIAAQSSMAGGGVDWAAMAWARSLAGAGGRAT